jgi:PTH1 family peptidyl-tRNA hydrolase
MKSTMLRLIVGLGNPGPEYENTRHNVGFWWVDAVAHRFQAQWRFERQHDAMAARFIPDITGCTDHIVLLKPQSYMNRSGKSVASIAHFYKIKPSEILVVHDELDIQPGAAKCKSGGGAAGHNGLKDITSQLGSPDYWRLRLGIGHPGVRQDVAGYVLRKPPASELDLITNSMHHSLEALALLLRGQMSEAVRHIHAGPQP